MVKLSEKEQDILIEIANIGSGNASKALEALSGCYVKPIRPELMVLPKERINIALKEMGDAIVYGDVDISGNIKGLAVFVFPKKDATNLSNAVAKKAGLAMRGISDSTFKEIFNIFTGNYLAAMAGLLDMRVLHGFPRLSIGNPKDIITKALASNVKDIICIKTIINIEVGMISGFFMLLMEPKEIRKLLLYINKKF